MRIVRRWSAAEVPGQADVAQAGAKNVSKIDELLGAAAEVVKRYAEGR